MGKLNEEAPLKLIFLRLYEQVHIFSQHAHAHAHTDIWLLLEHMMVLVELSCCQSQRPAKLFCQLPPLFHQSAHILVVIEHSYKFKHFLPIFLGGCMLLQSFPALTRNQAAF